MSTLTTKERNALPDSAFIFPKTRRYPYHDENHARAALSMVAKNGTPEEQTRVRAAVHKRYPHIGDPDKDEMLPTKERIDAWRARKKGGK